jgi:squalene-hopene/tetraprenyl-beta-curcumene cyclase
VVEQQLDGGWREGEEDSSPSPTAWVVLAFIAAGKSNHRACRRAVQFLVDTQQDDGGWAEPSFAVYDIQSSRWIHNALHATTWSLLALSRWAMAAVSAQSEPTAELSLRLVGAAADE